MKHKLNTTLVKIYEDGGYTDATFTEIVGYTDSGKSVKVKDFQYTNVVKVGNPPKDLRDNWDKWIMPDMYHTNRPVTYTLTKHFDKMGFKEWDGKPVKVNSAKTI